jgi:riboflavin kinase/FMN adenylyltransferase
VVPARSVDGEIISSTRIRAALRHGKVELASQLLGRPYLLEGSSVPGQKLGRTIGVPTLNLSPDPQLLPGNGVYAGYLWRAPTPAASTALPPIFPTPKDPQLIPAVINCGLRPTVSSDGNPTRHIEAHLLRGSYPSELYNYRCGIYFTDFIREERTFSSLALLQQQIHKDIVMAQEKLDV